MLFADHIEGLDNRIQLKKLRLWNAKFADTGAVNGVADGSPQRGLVMYETASDDVFVYGRNPLANGGSGTWEWLKLLDDSLKTHNVFLGVGQANKAQQVPLVKDGVSVSGGITLDKILAPTLAVDWGNQLLKNMSPPVDDKDAATKIYVDSQISSGGAQVMPVARASTTAALLGVYDNGAGTITATTNTKIPAASCDDVTLVNGDILLVKHQGTTVGNAPSSVDIANGLYTVQNVGSTTVKWVLLRHPDMDYGKGVPVPGDPKNEFHNALVPVKEGTEWSASTWHQETENPDMGHDGIEFRVTKIDTTYSGSNTIKIGNDNKLHLLRDPGVTPYLDGSLFMARNPDGLDTIRPATNGGIQTMPFLQCSGGSTNVWRASTYNIPRDPLAYSALGFPSSGTVGAVFMPAAANSVLCRVGSGAVGFYTKIPPSAIDLSGTWPLSLDKGGTNKDLLNGTPWPSGTGTYSALHTDTDNSRHGILFRNDRSPSSDHLEITKGPETTKDRILMHKRNPGGVSTPTSDVQGRKAWDWVALWDDDNHFRGSDAAKHATNPAPTLKIGPRDKTYLACQPVLLVENSTDVAPVSTSSSPSIGWRAKWNSSGVQHVDWTALARMNDTSGGSSWLLGRCRDTIVGSATSRKFLSVLTINDTGSMRTFSALANEAPWLTFARAKTDWSTPSTPGARGESSVRFSTVAHTGMHSDVLFTQPENLGTGLDSLEISGGTTTNLVWRGAPVDMAQGGFGANITGFDADCVFYKGSSFVNAVPNPTVDGSVLTKDRSGPPRWSELSFSGINTPVPDGEVGGVLILTDNNTIGVRRLGKTVSDVTAAPGAVRKHIQVVSTTSTTFTVDHGLGTYAVVVSVRQRIGPANTAANTQLVFTTVTIVNENQLTLTVANPPAASPGGDYVVTVIG